MVIKESEYNIYWVRSENIVVVYLPREVALLNFVNIEYEIPDNDCESFIFKKILSVQKCVFWSLCKGSHKKTIG